jgi:hypothetical protein
MSDMCVGFKRPKWFAITHKMSMNTMLPPYQLLAKIMLTNLWPIRRHTELTFENDQFMYVIAIDVSINLATHFIDVIQKATTEKEVSLPFNGLISKVATMTKVSLCDSEPIIKIFRKILDITIVKFKVVVSKKRSHLEESNSSQPKTSQTNPLLPLIIEQLQVLSNKFDSFTRK